LYNNITAITIYVLKEINKRKEDKYIRQKLNYVTNFDKD